MPFWKKVRDGTIEAHVSTKDATNPPTLDALLLRGYYNALTHGFCKELVEHGEHLWTFLDVEGVQPTNNAAEQAAASRRDLPQAFLRHPNHGPAVSLSSRMLTVIETCRCQRRNVYSWLVETVQAQFNQQSAPSLMSTV